MTANKFVLSAIALSVLGLAGCGGSSDSSSPQTAKVSFSIADAPVDGMSAVHVSYASFSLQHEDGTWYELPVQDENGNETIVKLNLLDYQNGKSQLVISNTELPIGVYKQMIINTYDCPQNKNDPNTESCNVIHADTGNEYPLKTPSNKLRLGGFEVDPRGVQHYTIDFNLRQSLVDTNGGYNLKPHGISIVDNGTVGTVEGTVTASLWNQCGSDEMPSELTTGVYLYQDADLDSKLTDEFDPDMDSAPEGYVAPFASQLVKFNDESNEYEYKFGFLPAGNYHVAFTCDAGMDDPEMYDGDLVNIPSPNLRANVVVEPGAAKYHNFDEADIIQPEPEQ